MTPLKHQVKYGEGYKDKAFLVHEGGTGKTVCACLWLKDGRDDEALVICPKRVVKKWQQALEDWGTKATVLSKENFKKESIKEWSAIVVDEADEFASPLFTKDRSALSTSLYNLVKTYDRPIMLLTATPIRSNPWNLHTLLTFFGKYIPWKDWRTAFFNLESKPFRPGLAYYPVENWRVGVRKTLEKYADIVLLKDCVDELPPVTERFLSIPHKKYTSEEVGNTAIRFDEHKHEQIDKHKKVLEVGKEYRKVLVVAYYVEQVEELAKQLSKNRETFMVHGGVKGQEDILQEAQNSSECYLVVQASLGAGFDADSFSCVVFASMDVSVRSFVQMKYRVRRIHNLHPVEYVYIFGGPRDKRVYEVIKQGRDFTPSEWND